MTGQTSIRTGKHTQEIRPPKSNQETAATSLSEKLLATASDNTTIPMKLLKHKPFSERLAEYGNKIIVCNFDWGEPTGKEAV